MHAHDGYEPHSHEVRADHMGINRVAAISDRTALDQIANMLRSAKYHEDADTLSEITDIVRSTGRNQEGERQ